MKEILGIITIVTIFCLYFLPTIIAYRRKHRQKDPIFLINLFLGWTFICWIVSLIWSVSHQPTAEKI
jgi:hypothetical protein